MKVCTHCQLSYDDSAQNCAQCGAPLISIQAPAVTDPTDHTAEFDPADISANKVLAMIPYLMGWFGILVTLLAAGTSPYAGFHVRQALKLQVVTALFLIVAIIPFVGWIVAGIWMAIALVLNLICFVRVCQGKAKEPPIISGMAFLK